MASKNDLKLRVLTILLDNLHNPQPHVVSLESIAEELQMNLPQTRQLLLCMDQAGVIKIDLDANYALITSEGLEMIREARGGEQMPATPPPEFAYPQHSTII